MTPAPVNLFQDLPLDTGAGSANLELAGGAALADLTTRMVKGGEAAYIEFHGLYFDRLFRYLLVVHRGNEEDAKEGLQLTLVRVVRHIKRFDDADIFWSWLTLLARSCSVDEQRKRFRYLAFLTRLSSAASLHEKAHREDHLEQTVSENLELMTPEDRDLIERKYFAEQSVREIADDLGASEKAVESRLTRVRRKLKESIREALKYE